MKDCHELLKHDNKNAVAWALAALEKDISVAQNVFLAENTHTLLLKSKKEQEAKQYFDKAQKVYKYSTYFEGELKETN